ncbi:MAG TPA: VOC family protein [Candidatus Nanopelagicales bacterium]|nr:VOC family protein [Candidatus Nanopelagicales bacterium]
MTLDLAALGARFDHTAVAGPSLAPLVAFYRDVLGGRFSHGEVLPIGAVVLTFELGDGRIELMAPTPGSTFFDRFLESTGGRGGVHHLTFAVDDLDAAVAQLQARGITMFGHVVDPDGIWSEVFVHPRDNGGVLVQLAQIGDIDSVVQHEIEPLLAAAQ